MKKIGLICLAVVLALGAMGTALALWSETLLIIGTVDTGKVDAIFVTAFTDDDGVVDNAAKDGPVTAGALQDDDLGELYDAWPAAVSSADPSGPGPNPPRYDKDVGKCTVEIDASDAQTLNFTVVNGYPSYWNTAWFDIKNTGTIPLKVQSLIIKPSTDALYDFTPGTELAVIWSGLFVGQQIEPGATAQGDLRIHVLQDAAELATYKFSAEIFLVQWNEFR